MGWRGPRSPPGWRGSWLRWGHRLLRCLRAGSTAFPGEPLGCAGVTELLGEGGARCFAGKRPPRLRQLGACRSSRGFAPCRGPGMAAPGSQALEFNVGRSAGGWQAGFLGDGRPRGRWSAVTSCAHAGAGSSRWGCRAWAATQQRRRHLRCAGGLAGGTVVPGGFRPCFSPSLAPPMFLLISGSGARPALGWGPGASQAPCRREQLCPEGPHRPGGPGGGWPGWALAALAAPVPAGG